MVSFFLSTQNSNFFNELANNCKIDKNKKAVIIVPEQNSFHTEKKALEFYKISKKEIEVLSFSRLAHNVFKNFGGITKKTAKKANKIAIINSVLFKLKNELFNFKFLINKPDFAELILKTIEQIKQNKSNYYKIEQKLKMVQNNNLKLKANEFWLIFKTYNLKLKSAFFDDSDILKHANKTLLKNPNAFSNIQFFFSEFFSFSNLQLQLIETLAKRTNLGFNFYYNNSDIFSEISKTIKTIKKIAEKNQIETSTTKIKFKTKKTKIMTTIEKILINPNLKLSNPVCKNCNNNIEFFAATSIFEEVEWTIFKIYELLKKKHNFSNITILATNLKLYKNALICSMEKFNIPFFMDDPISFGTMNLIKCCQNLIEAANDKKKLINSLTNLLKTDLTKFSIIEIAIFEIYAYIYEIENLSFFDKSFNLKNNISEFVKQNAQNLINEQNLKIFQKIQNTLIKAIKTIRNSENNSKNIAINIIKSLNILGIGTTRSKMSENFKLEWNSLISLLETIYESTKNSEIGLQQFEFLFKSTALNLHVKQIPPSLNCILIGSVQKTIPNEPKTMFIVGANELSLPKKQFSTNQLFSNLDLNKLYKIGINFGKTTQEQNNLNKLIAYRAICNATENLFLSFTTSQNQFISNKPCDVIKTLQNFFQIPITREDDNSNFIEKCITPTAATQQFALHFNEKTEKTEALKLFFKKNNKTFNLTSNLKSKYIKKSAINLPKTLSPSQIEQFFLCPFSYFCKYILKIKPVPKIEINNKLFGLAFHHILEKIVSLKNFKEINSSQIKTEIEQQCEIFIKNQFEKNSSLKTEFHQTFNPYKKILLNLLCSIQQELELSNFKPTFFEYSIGPGSKIESLKINLNGENKVLINGKIDRIDTKLQNNKTLIRIVDYKTSDKNLNFSNLFYGLNLQLILYAMAVERNKLNNNFTVNAIEYVKILGNLTTYAINEREPSTEKIEKLKSSGFFKKGLIFSNYTTSKNLILKTPYLNLLKQTELNKKILTKNEVEILFKFVENKIKKMCNSLNQFNFKHIQHTSNNNFQQTNCSFCPYNEICNPNLIETIKHKPNLEKTEFFELMKKELEN